MAPRPRSPGSQDFGLTRFQHVELDSLSHGDWRKSSPYLDGSSRFSSSSCSRKIRDAGNALAWTEWTRRIADRSGSLRRNWWSGRDSNPQPRPYEGLLLQFLLALELPQPVGPVCPSCGNSGMFETGPKGCGMPQSIYCLNPCRTRLAKVLANFLSTGACPIIRRK